MMFLNENEDSDQSISEDEDVDYNWSRNVVSLGSASEDKGNIQILSHLETLKDVHNLDCATKVTIECQQRQKNICIEDDVEHPVFNNEEHFGMASGCNSDEKIGIFPVLEQICCSEEEIISEDEKIIAGSVKCKREGSPSRASGHTEAALYLNENSGSSSACGISPKLMNPSNGCELMQETRGKPSTNFYFVSTERRKAFLLLPMIPIKVTRHYLCFHKV